MLNIVCVKWGKKYSSEYVNILCDMVRRNLAEGFPGVFVCFTDDPIGLDESIVTRELEPGVGGWWNKLSLFKPGTFPDGDRVLYLDLDIVVTGALDSLGSYTGEFAILKEFIGAGVQSSIMAWRAGAYPEIWESWIEQNCPETPQGDQAWIASVVKSPDILQDIFPGAFVSYKFDCRVGYFPTGSTIVVFHGEPKPDNCGESWVAMVWKIGGGTAAELEMSCNTENEMLVKNIRAACKRDVAWIRVVDAHDGHAVIVGGAPSLKDTIGEVQWRWHAKQKVFALNNVASFLLEHGIVPDAQVVVDARPENAEFVIDSPFTDLYIASQCAPEVWDEAQLNGKAVLWHSMTAALDAGLDNPEDKEVVRIGGGSTVGLSAMALVYALGYRNIHLFGMDSSYTEDAHHAYPQALNDADRLLRVDCEGRSFLAAPWMIAQANQFQTLALALADMDCTVTVSGDGLIPWIARTLQCAAIPDDTIVEIGGMFWPSRDTLGKPYIEATIGDVQALVSRCPEKRVAVQAGGNVGLWAKELAAHFAYVYTFEPDPLNFQCLDLNCNEPNIEARQAGLGEAPGRKSLKRMAGNCGAHSIIDGDEFEIVTIDGIMLDACDLIQLDIEGYELFALQGARHTIDTFKPLICLELKGLGAAYNVQDEDVLSWLSEHGYEETYRMGRDVIFAHQERESVCTTHTAQTLQ